MSSGHETTDRTLDLDVSSAPDATSVTKHLLLIGDSYGTERTGQNGQDLVLPTETWPARLAGAAENLGWQTHIDFTSYRTLVETARMVATQTQKPDLCIVQAGIVDVFPRTLPFQAAKSQSTVFRILRKFIRLIRPAWVRFVYWRPWVAEYELIDALWILRQSCKHLVLITYPSLSKAHANTHPGAQACIDHFNVLLRKFSEDNVNVSCCDLAQHVQSQGLCDRVVAPWDSHLNRSGNEYLFELVKKSVLQPAE